MSIINTIDESTEFTEPVPLCIKPLPCLGLVVDGCNDKTCLSPVFWRLVLSYKPNSGFCIPNRQLVLTSFDQVVFNPLYSVLSPINFIGSTAAKPDTQGLRRRSWVVCVREPCGPVGIRRTGDVPFVELNISRRSESGGLVSANEGLDRGTVLTEPQRVEP